VQRIAVADRRAALLGAALRVIARDGAARASTRVIAAEAGMPTASFHYVFASHAAMLEELVAGILEAQAVAVAEAVGEAGSLREFAGGALQGWLDRAAAEPAVEIALQDVVAFSRSSPELHHLAATVYEHYAASVAGFVAAAEERFGVRWTVPSADVARFVLVLTDGVAARWLVDRDEPAARRALALGADALLALVREQRP
jgi:TetR/AcrR family transcriptional regulator, regulator of biofilm formation and stress response